MIKKKKLSAAFTLIELLVVITIIGILAGIALPAFSSVQTKASQTKALSQTRNIGLALKSFAGDNDGVYPKTGVPTGLTASATDANSCFAALFPAYIQNETVFTNKLATSYATKTPDNQLDNPPVFPSAQTLASGENVYAYVAGLTDSYNPSSPLMADGFSQTIGQYAKTGQGGVWGGTKAVVVHLDNSATLETLEQAQFTVQGYVDNTGTKKNIFTPINGTWLDNCTVCNPRRGN